MTKEKTGGLAFPETKNNGFGYEYTVAGNLTVLDHFAGLAMQAIVSSMNDDDARAGASDAAYDLGKTMAEMYAHIAYAQAAAMIAERNRIMNEKP